MSLREVIIQARKISRQGIGDSFIVEVEYAYSNIIREIFDDIYRNPDIQTITYDIDTNYSSVPKLLVRKLENNGLMSSWAKINDDNDDSYRITVNLPN